MGTDGIQVGLDLYKTNKTQLGLLFGYEGSKATLRSDRLDADDVYFGVYAARVFRNGADFRVVYNYGSQDYKLNRLDPGLGLNWNTHNSKFNGNTNELNLELGKRIFANRRWSYRPVIGFDLLVNDWDGTQEDGNLSTAIAYDGADYTQAFLRIGSDL
ncbi:MAG: autotransporter outer membrane beta-barrel domain-containing protein, partial [Planctomycetaceae bacterium]|nr:autotransporter outer membrane beta-barrel domain-containing protein [Planctomycetaceae bacterium]